MIYMGHVVLNSYICFTICKLFKMLVSVAEETDWRLKSNTEIMVRFNVPSFSL